MLKIKINIIFDLPIEYFILIKSFYFMVIN